MDVKWSRTCFLIFVFGINLAECVITDVRLVGGPVSNKGTVEIRRDNGAWETTCGTDLGINDVIVICRQLGFTGANRAITNTPYGQNSIPTTGLNCTDDEADLSECGTLQSSSCSSAGAASCHGEWYLGCYADTISDRVLRGQSLLKDPMMTILRCIQLCQNSTTANYSYAGVQNADECFCGEAMDDYTRYTTGEVSDANCQRECTGDPTESCGGVFFIAVFNIYATTTATTYAVSEVTNESTTSVFLMTNQQMMTSDNETSSGTTTDLPTSTPLQQRHDSCLGVGVGEGIVIILLVLTTIALVMYIIKIRKTRRETEQNQNTNGMTLEKKSMSKDEDNSFYQDVEDVKLPGTSSLSPSGDAFYSFKIYEQKSGQTNNTPDMKRKELQNNADPYIEII